MKPGYPKIPGSKSRCEADIIHMSLLSHASFCLGAVMNRSIRCVAAAIAAALVLSASAALHAEENAGQGGEILTLCSFEEGASDRPWKAAGSEAAVEQGAAVGRRCLRWSVESGKAWFTLKISLDGMDLSGFSSLVLHMKADGEVKAGFMAIHLLTSKTDYFSYGFPALDSTWMVFDVPLALFDSNGSPDPKNVGEISLTGFLSGGAFAVLIDEIGLRKDARGWTLPAVDKLDFENPLHSTAVWAGQSRAVPAACGGSGKCLKWDVPGGGRTSWLYIRLVPRDIRFLEAVRFRALAQPALSAGRIRARFSDGAGNFLEIRLQELPSSWASIEVPLGYMSSPGPFNPSEAVRFELIVFNANGFALLLDDLEFVRGKRGEESWRREEMQRINMGDPASICLAHPDNSSIRLVQAEKNRSALEWKVPPGKKWVRLTLRGFSPDVRQFGALRIEMKSDRPVKNGEFSVFLCSSYDDYLKIPLPDLAPQWSKVDLLLPAFNPHKSVNPAGIRFIQIVGWGVQEVAFRFVNLEFLKGRRGFESWRPSEAEMKARIFGDRAGKVAEVRTRNFILQTDSRAALGKFQNNLEEMLEFVRTTLDLPAMKERLPVYIFQNAETYQEFCVNYAGYSAGEAEHTSGHGCSGYFATCYTEPKDPVVVHELAHSVVSRTLGTHGGSWLVEGFAVYAETRYLKLDPSAEFAAQLRTGNYTKLKEFIGIGTLAFVDSKKDETRAWNLYMQAGSFFAFLKDGPFADRFRKLLDVLLKSDFEPAEQAKIIERIYGRPLEELDEAWVEWGTRKRK